MENLTSVSEGRACLERPASSQRNPQAIPMSHVRGSSLLKIGKQLPGRGGVLAAPFKLRDGLLLARDMRDVQDDLFLSLGEVAL